MYSLTTADATETAARALSDIAEYFALGARSCNGTSSTARREAALRVAALEALEALDSIEADDDGPMPANVARTAMKPLVELLGLVDEPAPAAWETPVDVLALSLPPLAGGAPFEPSEEDWEDFAAWCDSVDRERDVDAIHRDMYGY